MNENNLDLEHINEVDMECNFVDDDDFGTTVTDHGEPVVMENENRAPVKTGIIINLNDDDDNVKSIKKNHCKSNEHLDNMNVITPENQNNNLSGINEIDMETSLCDDDDEDLFEYESIKNKNKFSDIVDFGDDDEELPLDQELIDEEILAERRRKRKVTTGEVEADYWKKITKRHADSNKKGAYNTHFHIGGNPEKERELFNHDMTVNKSQEAPNIANGDITGTVATPVAAASGEASDGAAVASAGAGEGCCEKFDEQYNKKLNEIFDIIGFEIKKDKDGSYIAKDLCDKNSRSAIYPDLNSLVDNLKPYIEDCFIYPLQYKTNQSFSTPKEWVDWYDDKNKENYPDLDSDIKYCDLLANHLSDCK